MKCLASINSVYYHFTREPIAEGGYCVGSVQFVCPLCHKSWGFIHCEGDGVFIPECVSCESCNWADGLHPVPGSILVNGLFPSYDPVDWALLEALPTDLLAREGRLTLEAFTQGFLHELTFDRHFGSQRGQTPGLPAVGA